MKRKACLQMETWSKWTDKLDKSPNNQNKDC